MKNALTFSLAGLLLAGLSENAAAQCAASFTAVNTISNTVLCTTQPVTSGTLITYTWDFGDNSGYVNVQNTPTVSHNYNSNGVFTITMHYSDSASTPGCYTLVTNTVAVTQGSGCNDVIDFTWTPGANGHVQFYGASNNNPGYTYTWNFGDGHNGSGFSTPHTYSASGTYTVILTGSTNPAVCTYSVSKVVTVSVVPCPFSASFSTAIAGNQVTLTSTSSGTGPGSMYYWTLGDGHTAYTQNVVHTYSNNGNYPVSLIVTDSAAVWCQDTVTQTVAITSGSCLLNMSFTVIKDSTQALTWYVYPTITGAASSVQWNWGDGQSSNTLYTTHTFSAAGAYNICLSATATCGTNTTVCLQSNIYRSSGPEAITVIVKAPVTGVEETSAAQPLAIAPNPSGGVFSIRLPNAGPAPATLRAYDVLGKQVVSMELGDPVDGAYRVNLEALSAGTYLLMLDNGLNVSYGRVILTK